MTQRVYEAFLGSWTLIPESARYEQGDPPRSGRYTIEEESPGVLRFTARWIDAEGKDAEVVFSGPADGSRTPFPGGELADALAIEAVSSRELNSYAYLDGKELMVAQRQLDDTGTAMRITQVVRLPDGTRPANVALYRRIPDA
jgi:hypothetical protein